MIQLVKGTKDIYGAEVKAWQEIEGKMRRICETFGIGEIRTPAFEFTELFARGVGETTDIVQKEMYTFTDDGDRSLTLRPEGTSGAVRAYVEHGMHNQAQPTKLYYISPTFRCRFDVNAECLCKTVINVYKVLSAVLLFIPIVTILYVFFPVTVRTLCMVK